MKTNKIIPENLSWFDIFEWPFTRTECWRFSPISSSLVSAIPTGINSIESLNGFYFLPKRKELFEKRIARQKIAIKKIKIAKRSSDILSFVPFVEMIAICNDAAYFNAPAESDIDFFIVAKPKRIWTVRFLCVAALSIFNLWRHGKKIKNRICLSFFVTDDNLNIESFSYENDILLKYWTPSHFPLFSKNDSYQKFLVNNPWIKKDFPNYFENIPSPKIKIKQKKFQAILEKILHKRSGNAFEKFLKFLQLKIMRKTAPWQKEKDVMISDQILKFHENDRRKYFKNIFESKTKLLK